METTFKGERCPGEEPCTETPRARLYTMRGKEPVETTCEGCPLKATKPGGEPVELMAWINTALDLDALKEQGARFAYPEALDSREWVAMKALGIARGKAQEKDSKRREQERREQAERQRLQARVNRDG